MNTSYQITTCGLILLCTLMFAAGCTTGKATPSDNEKQIEELHNKAELDMQRMVNQMPRD